MTQPQTYRSSRAGLLVMAMLAVCAVPLAFASPWLVWLMLLPLAGAFYLWRTGTRADADGITVFSIGSVTKVSWAEVDHLEGDRGKVFLVTREGARLRLPGVNPADVGRLAHASDGRLQVGTPG